MKRMETEWQTYRTRFLVKAKRLTRGMAFVDALGREQRGNKGDYLVESCDGAQRIVPREFFEDVYVNMGTGVDPELMAPAGALDRWEWQRAAFAKPLWKKGAPTRHPGR